MKRDKNERGMEEVEDVESILMFTRRRGEVTA